MRGVIACNHQDGTYDVLLSTGDVDRVVRRCEISTYHEALSADSNCPAGVLKAPLVVLKPSSARALRNGGGAPSPGLIHPIRRAGRRNLSGFDRSRKSGRREDEEERTGGEDWDSVSATIGTDLDKDLKVGEDGQAQRVDSANVAFRGKDKASSERKKTMARASEKRDGEEAVVVTSSGGETDKDDERTSRSYGKGKSPLGQRQEENRPGHPAGTTTRASATRLSARTAHDAATIGQPDPNSPLPENRQSRTERLERRHQRAQRRKDTKRRGEEYRGSRGRKADETSPSNEEIAAHFENAHDRGVWDIDLQGCSFDEVIFTGVPRKKRPKRSRGAR